MSVYGELNDALTKAEANASLRAIIIRSQGKHFCTGAELGEVKEQIKDAEELAKFLDVGHALLSRLEASRHR